MPKEQELSKNINNSKKYGNANLDRHNGITSPRRSRTGTGGGSLIYAPDK
jgi:hypothetical protein